jgi:hypothetical protein
MNSTVTQENIKAIGVLVAAFLASIVVASFFYLQPGQAEASVSSAPCTSKAVVEDVSNRDNAVRITIDTTANCPANNLVVSTLSSENYKTVIRELGPSEVSDGHRYEFTLEIYDYVDAYNIKIPGAFAGSIVP